MTFLFVLLGIAIITTAAVLISGRYAPNWGVTNSGDYRPEIGGKRIGERPEFDLAIRGYRMDEVDATIAELTAKLEDAERNRKGHNQ